MISLHFRAVASHPRPFSHRAASLFEGAGLHQHALQLSLLREGRDVVAAANAIPGDEDPRHGPGARGLQEMILDTLID